MILNIFSDIYWLFAYLWRKVYSYLLGIFKLRCLILLLSFRCFLYWTLISDIRFFTYFLPLCGLSFTWLIHKIFVCFFLLLPTPFTSYPRSHCQTQCCKAFVMFSKNFIVSGLTFGSLIHFFQVFWLCHAGMWDLRLQPGIEPVLPAVEAQSLNQSITREVPRPLIHFELIFVYSARWESNFILLHVDVQFFQHHLLKRLSFPHWTVLAPSSKIIWHIFESLFLSFLFCFIVLYVCLYASTILFWLLEVCNKIWNQEVWILLVLFFFKIVLTFGRSLEILNRTTLNL